MCTFGNIRVIPKEWIPDIHSGSRVVVFDYCISVLVVTFRRQSRCYLFRPGQRRFPRAIPYLMVSLLLGWWGLPWGVVVTVATILTNLGGGRDVTAQVSRE